MRGNTCRQIPGFTLRARRQSQGRSDHRKRALGLGKGHEHIQKVPSEASALDDLQPPPPTFQTKRILQLEELTTALKDSCVRFAPERDRVQSPDSVVYVV